MHDEAPSCSARKKTDALQQAGIELILWSPCSRDLNLIECVWNIMKSYIQDHEAEVAAGI